VTTSELQSEIQYRIEERLGILCGIETPTFEQRVIAKDEALKWAEENHPKLYSTIVSTGW
jgi:hypothetical protein